MTASRPQRDFRSTVIPLPRIADDQVPGWYLTRHAVTLTLVVFVTVVLGAIMASAIVTVRVTVDGSGFLEPENVWPVRSMEGGVISAILVRTGDAVRAGQVVMTLDSAVAMGELRSVESQIAIASIDLVRAAAALPISIDQAHVRVSMAEARLARARSALRDRMTDFSITGDPDSVAGAMTTRGHLGLDPPSADLLVAKGELETARLDLASAMLAALDTARRAADLRRLKAATLAAQATLARHAIRSPANGVVLSERIGQLRGAAITAGQPIIDIGDVSRWRATIGVDEQNVHRVRVGDTVDVDVRAFSAMPANRLRGRVEAVGWQPSPTLAAATGTPTAVSGYRVDISVDAADMVDRLRRGYAVHAAIVTRSGTGLSVAIEYLRDKLRSLR